MSTVVYTTTDSTGNKQIRSIVKASNGRYYCVDTADTFDRGPETMVFRYNKDYEVVTDWNDLYVRNYPDMEDAYDGHSEISSNLEKYIAV